MTRIIKTKIKNAKLVNLFLVAIVLTSIFYLYFLINTIHAVVESRNNHKNIQIISQEYQSLENKYFHLLERIDIDYARQLGFVDQPLKTDYIVRQTDVAYGGGF